MKNAILSADGDSIVYAVPDIVAENLREYCIEFCDHWLKTSPDAEQYRLQSGFSYTETDFIGYLNRFLFPDEQSEFVANIGWTNFGKNLPAEYADCPFFNF